MKKLFALIISITILGVLITFAQYTTETKEQSRIGEIAERIDELHGFKQNCFDSLTYKESIKAHEGKEKFCFQWDEEIIALREESDKLQAENLEFLGL